jgi:hypothetical protein
MQQFECVGSSEHPPVPRVGLNHTPRWGNFRADLANYGHPFRTDAGRERVTIAVAGNAPCFRIVRKQALYSG